MKLVPWQFLLLGTPGSSAQAGFLPLANGERPVRGICGRHVDGVMEGIDRDLLRPPATDRRRHAERRQHHQSGAPDDREMRDRGHTPPPHTRCAQGGADDCPAQAPGGSVRVVDEIGETPFAGFIARLDSQHFPGGVGRRAARPATPSFISRVLDTVITTAPASPANSPLPISDAIAVNIFMVQGRTWSAPAACQAKAVEGRAQNPRNVDNGARMSRGLRAAWWVGLAGALVLGGCGSVTPAGDGGNPSGTAGSRRVGWRGRRVGRYHRRRRARRDGWRRRSGRWWARRNRGRWDRWRDRRARRHRRRPGRRRTWRHRRWGRLIGCRRARRRRRWRRRLAGRRRCAAAPAVAAARWASPGAAAPAVAAARWASPGAAAPAVRWELAAVAAAQAPWASRVAAAQAGSPGAHPMAASVRPERAAHAAGRGPPPAPATTPARRARTAPPRSRCAAAPPATRSGSA